MKTLIVTGAGISLASGIPTFRGSDPNAIWAQDVMEKGTYRFFARNPVESWNWYADRFFRHAHARPNAAHEALVAWEKKEPDFLLVTQNVDTLHEQAGSQNLVKVHGSVDRIRCARIGCKWGAPKNSLPLALSPEESPEGFAAYESLNRFYQNPSFNTLPRCSACHKLLRPHVLWFDESYLDHREYQIKRVLEFARRADVVYFIGTSFAVGVTDLIMRESTDRPWGCGRAEVFVIDPNPVKPHPACQIIQEKAEEWLPRHVGSLS